MKILVAGGAGVLGSHMVDRLIKEGHEIHVIDNLQTSKSENLVQHTQNQKQFKFLKHDITDTEWMQSFGRHNPGFKQVWNFACPASPPLYQIDPVHTMMTCVLGTKNLLDIAYSNKAVFFQASTSEVYGNPEFNPQREDYRGNVNTLGPRACYDEGKRAAEALCMDYHRKYDVRVKIARIFNTYSHRNNPGDGRVVPNFIHQALNGKDLTVYGDGSQTRSLCHWEDAIEGYYRLMNYTANDFTGPVNIGNQQEISMLNLAKTIIFITGHKSKIVYEPLPIDDPERRNPDCSLAFRILGWEPKYSLYDGLLEVINHVK